MQSVWFAAVHRIGMQAKVAALSAVSVRCYLLRAREESCAGDEARWSALSIQAGRSRNAAAPRL